MVKYIVKTHKEIPYNYQWSLWKEWFCIIEVTCSILQASQQGFEKYFSLASEPASLFY